MENWKMLQHYWVLNTMKKELDIIITDMLSEKKMKCKKKNSHSIVEKLNSMLALKIKSYNLVNNLKHHDMTTKTIIRYSTRLKATNAKC